VRDESTRLREFTIVGELLRGSLIEGDVDLPQKGLQGGGVGISGEGGRFAKWG
jgi:hypothetical protein